MTRWTAGLLACGLLVAACGDDDGGAVAASTTAPTTADAGATTTTGPTDGALERYVFLTGIDVDGRTLTVEPVQFLTGQEAIDAYHRDFPDDPEGPPNDFYIVDDDSPPETVTVAPDAQVQLVRLQEDSSADLTPGTFEELPSYLEAYADAEHGRLSFNPFMLTVVGDQVVGIQEQYTP